MKKKNGLYGKYIKRLLDILCSALGMTLFSWLYGILAVLVRIKLGKPIIYKTERPGRIDPKTGQERIFELYKFRSMTNETDKNGELLPDKQRLTEFGRRLRATSLDELPEVFNILKGDMSIVGPRPLSVKYLPFYTQEERHRHDVRPGLTGLAQVSGRNNLSWDEKFQYDLRYIKKITLIGDIKILLKTIKKVFGHEGIGQGEEMPTNLYDERKNWKQTPNGAIKPDYLQQ